MLIQCVVGGTYCKLHDHTYQCTGIYLFFMGTVYANNSVIFINLIGETDTSLSPPQNSNNGLQCITDRMPCCRSFPNTAGEWFFPDGTMVPIQDDVTTFYRNRGRDDGTINLNRVNTNVMSPSGLFHCMVPDATDTIQTACINIGKPQLLHVHVLFTFWFLLHII